MSQEVRTAAAGMRKLAAGRGEAIRNVSRPGARRGCRWSAGLFVTFRYGDERKKPEAISGAY